MTLVVGVPLDRAPRRYPVSRQHPFTREWRELARRVRIHGPIPTEIDIVGIRGEAILEVVMRVEDVNTGCPTSIVFTQHVSPLMPPDVQWLRHAVRAAWLHELDERFTVDGERPFDPHAAEPSGGIARRP